MKSQKTFFVKFAKIILLALVALSAAFVLSACSSSGSGSKSITLDSVASYLKNHGYQDASTSIIAADWQDAMHGNPNSFIINAGRFGFYKNLQEVYFTPNDKDFYEVFFDSGVNNKGYPAISKTGQNTIKTLTDLSQIPSVK